MKHTVLWDQVEKTNPKYTKQFKKGGGFSGTAINPTWLTKRATEVFGPMGIGWGFERVDEQIVDGPLLAENTHEKLHIFYGCLWYNWDGETGKVYQYGQTTLVGKNKFGTFMDEEAPKKSYTDALSKALSLLGFSTDVYLGLWDDNKYVNDRMQEQREEDKKEERLIAAAEKAKEAILEQQWAKWTETVLSTIKSAKDLESLSKAKADFAEDYKECPLVESRKAVKEAMETKIKELDK